MRLVFPPCVRRVHSIFREFFAQCMPFGAGVSMASSPSPRRSTAVNLTPSHPLVHPQSPPVQAAVPPDMGGTRLQRGSDEGEDDRALSEQSTRRADYARPIFECCICMEEVPMDSITHPVTALFDEYEFIVLCPACNAAKGKGKAGGTQGGTCRPQIRTLRRLIM